MNYNIEKVNQIAQQVAEMVQEAIEEEGPKRVLIGDVELAMREGLRRIGQQALPLFLEADDEVVREMPCECGGLLKYQRQRAATIWSVFGKVVYRRDYYAGCRCGKGHAPVDERYGIEPGKVTSGLAHLLSLSGIHKAFEMGSRWLKEFLLFEVSENTVRSETQKMGELQRQLEETLIRESQEEASLQARERNRMTVPDILYGSIDAGKVRIEPRDEQEKAAKNRENWRDLKVGSRKNTGTVCWYEGEIVPTNQRSTRQKKKVEREGTVIRAKNKKYFCDIAQADEFGKLLWATACAVGADRVRTLVFICDGAVWIWNLITYYTQRLKLPGAQWEVEGAVLTAKARAAWLSGTWNQLVQARSLLPLAA